MSEKIEIHEAHENELVEKTKDLIADWDCYINNSEEPHIAKDMFIIEPGIAISKIYADNFDKIVESIYKKCKDYILKSTVKYEFTVYLDNIIGESSRSDEKIKMELSRLISRLSDKVKTREIVFPIDNLALSNLNEIEIGSVKLMKFTQLAQEENKEILRPKVITSPKLLFDRIIEKAGKDPDKVWAKIEVISEDQNQYQKALVEYENIINLMRIYLECQDDSDQVKIGLHEDFHAQTILLSFTKGEPYPIGANVENKRIGANYTITPERLKEWKDKYYSMEIGSILKETPRSKLNEKILLAIRWAGEGIHEESNSDKIIKFTTALECLLIDGKDGKSKKESLAERCAFLLEEKNACKRLKIYRYIKGHDNIAGLYDIRSHLVHDGEADIDPKSVDLLCDLTIRCLFRVISLLSNPEIKKIQDIIAFVDCSKMKCYYEDQ